MSNTATEIKGDEGFYELLGINSDAKESEIRKAYRKTAIKYHPDKNPSKDAAEMFNRLLEALKILTTPDLRKRYDTLYHAAKEKKIKNDLLKEERRKLQDELKVREGNVSESYISTVNEKRKVESLKEEGFKKRKLRDNVINSNKNSLYDTKTEIKTNETIYTQSIDEKISRIRQKIASI